MKLGLSLLIAASALIGCSLESTLTRAPVPEELERELEGLRGRVARSPEDAAGHILLGNAALKAGRTFEAADAYRAALERTPNDSKARAGLAEAYSALGFYFESFQQLAACLERSPHSPDCLFKMGMMLRSEGSREGAVEAKRLFERFIEVAGNHERAPLVRQILAQIESQLQKAAEEGAAAAPAPQGAAPRGPAGSPHAGVPGAPPIPGHDHDEPGHEGHDHDAPGGEEPVGELNPFGVAIQKGMVAMRNKDAKTAEAAFSEALTLKAGDAIALAGLAEAQHALGKAADAESNAIKALEVEPQGGQSRYVYGLVMLKSGKNVDRAIEAWRSLARDDPEYAKGLGITEKLEQIDKLSKSGGAKPK